MQIHKLAAVGLLLLAGCATPSAPAETPAKARSKAHAPAKAKAPEDPAPSSSPSSWQEALDRYSSTCPVPFFTLPHPASITVAKRTFTMSGSVMTLEGGRWQGPLKLGVLGAIKDADDETRENIKKAAAAFKKAGVQFVVANGDLIANETSVLVPVVQMLGEELDVPVFAHSGNYEWTSAFTQAFAEGASRWPHLINMNLVRDVDFGGVHLLSLPGYFNRRFLQSGACHYSDVDVAELTQRAKDITGRGDIVVLTSHGPPLGAGPTALDVTNDGANVGDEQLNLLLTDGNVSFGIFSHILESGGRVVDDVAGSSAVTLPMKTARKRLYVNVGAATAFGWGMIGGKTSRGMAAIFTIDPGSSEGRVEVLELR
ncbi:MAG: hypothetical protein Q8O67_21440 [Deltaproteobacteria bacterium]|nr:hypothetical protein [Deltaproteobacteria bacterium]